VAISDESWAERSQAGLGAVQVGRLVVAPPWLGPDSGDGPPVSGRPAPLWIVIRPSMGFGTGHHQTTRLCLQLLQQVPIGGCSVLDVGTGSGVLAIAAARLGAARVLAVDVDCDALEAARQNVEINGVGDTVTLVEADLGQDRSSIGRAHDVLLANLTGPTLVRHAPTLVGTLVPGGTLIASGLLGTERRAVRTALVAAGARVTAEAVEDEWVALRARRV
jgi:ribosomal protein L11 methyltransferase